VTAMDAILVVNAGSSSVKFRIYDVVGGDGLVEKINGQVDGIGVRPRMRADDGSGSQLIDQIYEARSIPDVETAMRTAGAWLRDDQKLTFRAIGHRIVHGGPKYSKPTLIDETLLDELERYIPLAPLHQPNNLAPIRILMQRFPDMPQVACFDTAFHRGHSDVADRYAIPEELHAEGVRRYGFHGLSCEYVSQHLRVIAPGHADGRLVIAHLGSGASMCAVAHGQSVESTMGFTALDGLPMGTRCGQIDPGVLLYLLSEKGMSAKAVQDFLYKDCGLKGLSGVSNDVRELIESSEPSASLALDYFVYRIGLNAGMLAAALGGIDSFVFTAGIGERSAVMRQRIANKLGWLGAEIDELANASGAICISRPGSRLNLFVVLTNEELMIARHTLAAIDKPNEAAAAFARTA